MSPTDHAEPHVTARTLEAYRELHEELRSGWSATAYELKDECARDVGLMPYGDEDEADRRWRALHDASFAGDKSKQRYDIPLTDPGHH